MHRLDTSGHRVTKFDNQKLVVEGIKLGFRGCLLGACAWPCANINEDSECS